MHPSPTRPSLTTAIRLVLATSFLLLATSQSWAGGKLNRAPNSVRRSQLAIKAQARVQRRSAKYGANSKLTREAGYLAAGLRANVRYGLVTLSLLKLNRLSPRFTFKRQLQGTPAGRLTKNTAMEVVKVFESGAAFQIGSVEMHNVEQTKTGTVVGTIELRYADGVNASLWSQKKLELHPKDVATLKSLTDMGLTLTSRSQNVEGQVAHFSAVPQTAMHKHFSQALTE